MSYGQYPSRPSGSPPPANGPRWPGTTALITASAALLLSVAGVWGALAYSGPQMDAFFDSGWHASESTTEGSELLGLMVTTLIGTIVVQGVATLLGLSAIVFGIVSVKSHGARTAGIIGMVIAVLAPVVSILIFTLVMRSY